MRAELEEQAARDLGLVTERARELEGEQAFNVVDLANLMAAEPPSHDYVLRPLIPCGFVTLGAGHGGAGKSVLALTWAAHCAAGRQWEGINVHGGRTVFLSLEDDGDMIRRRLRRIIAHSGLDAATVARNLIVLDGTTGDSVLARESSLPGVRVFGPTRAYLELQRIAAGARFIVVDNASDAFDGNENERRTVRQFVRLLAQVARDNGAAVLLLAHVDKAAARDGGKRNTYSGSTAWHNSARSRFALVTDDDGAVTLVHEKHNLGRLGKPLNLCWNENGMLVLAEGQSAPAPSHDQLHADADAVLEALRAAHAAGVNVPAARLGAHTARQALATCGLPKQLVDERARFWAAVDFLLIEKCAQRETYTTSQRRPGERIVPFQRCA